MFTTLLRIIKYGIQSFKRNVLTSVATVVVMVLALLMFQGLILFNMLTNNAVQSLEDKIDISVYFKTTTTEDTILNISRSLESLTTVRSVTYISREEALKIFQEKKEGDPIISQALEELGENPLLASLNIKAKDPGEYGAIAKSVAEGFGEYIDKISYDESQAAIERLNKIITTAERLGFALTIFLALTAILVTFNTIQLAIYSNREEIGIMRLVGASNVFIRGPYVVEAVVFGIIAAVVSMAVIAPMVHTVSPYLSSFLEQDIQVQFYGSFFSFLFYQLLFGIGLGALSGIIAIRRYLKI
jgi:cell division transport system permease protein